MIRVLVVAPAPAIRAGLRALLRADETLEVIGELVTLDDVAQLPPETDVLVTTESVSPAALDRLLRSREGRVALLLLADAPESAGIVVGRPVRAWGLLPLDATGEELAAAVRALHVGLLVGVPPLMEPLLRSRLLAAGESEPLDEPLTARETEVLQLLAQGLANKQIAAALQISEHTVKFHVSSIYAKLGVTNRTEAVGLGVRRGLVVL
ncbi:MAG: response regulator transcription factor [Ardenticatenaceae bacterium]|nr:response regulator transcription factor [Ardenticatenaceae bacterium]